MERFKNLCRQIDLDLFDKRKKSNSFSQISKLLETATQRLVVVLHFESDVYESSSGSFRILVNIFVCGAVEEIGDRQVLGGR